MSASVRHARTHFRRWAFRASDNGTWQRDKVVFSTTLQQALWPNTLCSVKPASAPREQPASADRNVDLRLDGGPEKPPPQEHFGGGLGARRNA
jgi:hypothetical protein